jgi:hypothetical protein
MLLARHAGRFYCPVISEAIQKLRLNPVYRDF